MRFVVPVDGTWILVRRAPGGGFSHQELVLRAGDSVEVGPHAGEAICLKANTTRPPPMFKPRR